MFVTVAESIYLDATSYVSCPTCKDLNRAAFLGSHQIAHIFLPSDIHQQQFVLIELYLTISREHKQRLSPYLYHHFRLQ